SPDRSGRSGHRLRRRPDPGLQPQRPARGTPRHHARAGQGGLEARRGSWQRHPPGLANGRRRPPLYADGLWRPDLCPDGDDHGSRRWVRDLGAASSDAETIVGMGMGMGMGGGLPSHDFGHRLLSLDGPTIYYQTNLGAVIALEADSGSIRWVATYPRQDRFG